MALTFAKISIQGSSIVAEEGYDPILFEYTCFELMKTIEKLHLENLKHMDIVLNTIFNQSQCQEILEKEIPILLAANLSEKAREAVVGLEHALKDITDPFHYLLLEGD